MIDFSKMRFLVVDDFSEFRSSIRGILGLLAVQKVDTAANGEEVLELCRRNRYDVILHDYNLGDGLNGQQVLEQLHAEKLLSPYCIFIMVTAENTQAMVLAAIECEPDDYLSKPFSKVSLQTRLERQVRRKQVLAPVLSALDGEDFEAVLEACDEIAAADARHAVLCQRQRARALCKLGRYLELEQMLESLARSRPAGWNMQSLARLWLRQGRDERASALLTAAIRQFPLMADLHDIRAEQLAAQNALNEVQAALQQAVSLSPNPLNRQILLARHAWLNGRADVAVAALHHCWEIGRYSMRYSPEALWQMLSMQLLARNTVGDEQKRWLRTLQKNDMQTPAIAPATQLLHLALRVRQGGQPETDEVNQQAQAILQHLPHYSAVSLLQLGDWLLLLDQATAAQRCWEFCARRYGADCGLAQALAQRAPNLDVRAEQQAVEQVRQAVACHYLEQPEQAAELFAGALQLAPELLQANMAAIRFYGARMFNLAEGASAGMRDCVARLGTVSSLDNEFFELRELKASLEARPW